MTWYKALALVEEKNSSSASSSYFSHPLFAVLLPSHFAITMQFIATLVSFAVLAASVSAAPAVKRQETGDCVQGTC